MRHIIVLMTAMAAFFSGCVQTQLDPAWLEDRTVQPAADAKKTFTVKEGMVFYDAAPATRGIRFPSGTYTLEAEDTDYFYLRSSTPLEFRTFKAGQPVDGRTIPGGIMVAKHFSIVPAAGYIDGDGAKKMAVWKLGQEFLAVEGTYWTKSF